MGKKNNSKNPDEPKENKDASQQRAKNSNSESSTSNSQKKEDSNKQQRPQQSQANQDEQQGAWGGQQQKSKDGQNNQRKGGPRNVSQQGGRNRDQPQQQKFEDGRFSQGGRDQQERGGQQQVRDNQQRGAQQQKSEGGRNSQDRRGQQQSGGQQQARDNQQQRGAPGTQQPQQQKSKDGRNDQAWQGQQQSGAQQQVRDNQQRGAPGKQQQKYEDGRSSQGGRAQQERGGQQQVRDNQQRGAQGTQQQKSEGGRNSQDWRGQQQSGGQQQARDNQQRGAPGKQQQKSEDGRSSQGWRDQQQRGDQQQVRDNQQRGAQGTQQQKSEGGRNSQDWRGQQQSGGQQQARDNQQRGAPSTHQPQQQKTEVGRNNQTWQSQQQGGAQQQVRDNQQRGPPGTQQRGTWSQEQSGPKYGDQQRGPEQGRTGRQQGDGQQQYGRGQQQRSQGGYNQNQQVRTGNQPQPSTSNEVVLPVKEKSCNGVVRGTLGKPGSVEVNYLRLNLDKMPDEAYHYDVTITPDRPKKFLRPAFEQFTRQNFPNIVLTFDGFKNCYSMERLKTPIEKTIEVADSGNRTKEFHVRIQETDNCIVDLKSLRNYQTERVFDKPMRALQVLEVVLASSNHERGIRVGRSFFRRPMDAFYLEDGYEAWTGLFQAAILGEMPLLNVDIAHKSFPCESTVIQYLDNINANKNEDLRNNNWSFRDISSFFNGVNIVYTPPTSFNAPPKQYKVMGIGEPASTKTFKTDDGNETTVAKYYRSKGYNLQYPNLNCLTVGSTVRQISLPMELCAIPAGQALNKKDQSRQVEKMIRYAATSTNTRKRKIMDLLTYFNHNANPIIRSFGLSIGSNFLKVPMRLLPSPSLEYLQGRTVNTFKGAWRMDENKFLICSKPPNGHRWAILYEESRGGRGISYHDLEEFKTLVIKTSQGLNMNLQNTAEIASYRVQQLQGMLKDFSRKFDLVFVVLSERGTAYAKIKQIAELEVGILTQCIKDKTVFRTKKDRTVFSNILLKVNGKLNGTNHKIAQDRSSTLLAPVKNVMYLGADVTHPSPDQRHIPSVVGVAASHDAHGACYNCQYRLQRSTVENIEDMESIASRHLDVYHQYQNKYPELIIYYRDGVSDGQFPIVEREEIRAIKRACTKKRINPKLTCIIVVKRHHTRFFPLTSPQHDRDFNNVSAGTVVDQYITHPNEVQFFMVSHQSIQGTARPTRYNVIMDESKFDINLLQKLTYDLCHLFPRCNRAVSYPAPAYLAHLVAFRGRVYLEGTQRFDKNLNNEYNKRQIKPDFMNRNPMYFI